LPPSPCAGLTGRHDSQRDLLPAASGWTTLSGLAGTELNGTSEIDAVTTARPKLRRARSLARPEADSLLIAAVAGLTLLGFGIRLSNFNQGLIGDELSTYWIIHGHGLGDVLSSIHSNDEITPPLYFILGWVSLKIGAGPEWVRLPSLLAGTALIPMVYLIGMRTIGRGAGLVAAAVMALSPFMIYYSTEARAYALMTALVAASTLGLLAALRTGRARWWVVYAICSCGAVYTHYTVIFPLAAQAAWALWFHREAVRALLLANLAAAIGFAPWIPGYIADQNSPTTKVLSALRPFTFDVVRLDIERWSVGYPYLDLDRFPGNLASALIAAGLLLAIVAGAERARRWLRASRLRLGAALRRVPQGVVLVALLALATPVGEAIYSAVGPTQVFGARDLNSAWPGLAVAIGGIISAAGPTLGLASLALVLAGYGIGAGKLLGSSYDRADYREAAQAIEDRWKPGDVVIDGAAFTPVPLTGLDVFLPQTHPEFRLGHPVTDRPLIFGGKAPPLGPQIQEAIKAAKGHTIFLVAFVPVHGLSTGRLTAWFREQDLLSGSGEVLRELPHRFKVTDSEGFPGMQQLEVFTIEDRGAQS
jgi:hypothetical protein